MFAPIEVILVFGIAAFLAGFQIKVSIDRFRKGKCGCYKCREK